MCAPEYFSRGHASAQGLDTHLTTRLERERERKRKKKRDREERGKDRHRERDRERGRGLTDWRFSYICKNI